MFNKEFNLPASDGLHKVVRHFSVTEKVLLFILSLAMSLSVILILFQLQDNFSSSIPSKGGLLKEGVLGIPSFINPVLSIRDVDRDLTSLIYSGLFKSNENGLLRPDLASGYSISEDNLSYSVFIREDASFHDGNAVTADDVIFTISKIQDPNIKSPKRASFEGVAVEKVSDKIVKFSLKQPYSPFLENLTIGIMPKHLWQKIEPDRFALNSLNTSPIGSGPFYIGRITKDKDGVPIAYNLLPFKNYTIGAPYIGISFFFKKNEEDLLESLKDGEIDSVGSLSPSMTSSVESQNIVRVPLPRVFGVFFNQNQNSVFINKEVREALDVAVSKEEIVEKVLYGFGRPLSSPIPFSLISKDMATTSAEAASLPVSSSTLSKIELAKNILEKAGWKIDESTGVYIKEVKKEKTILSFTLSTSNTPELKVTADLLKDMWTKMGAEVSVQIFDSGDLNQNVIRPRKYDALLFGEVVGRDLDLFAFWHSSQRNDPGLNIALYTDINADKALEKARVTFDREERLHLYRQLEKEIISDKPAVFLFSPDFLYFIPDKIKGENILNVSNSSDRFLNVNEWYIKTEKIWSIFND